MKSEKKYANIKHNWKMDRQACRHESPQTDVTPGDLTTVGRGGKRRTGIVGRKEIMGTIS